MNRYLYVYDGRDSLEEFECHAPSREAADALALAHSPAMLDNLVELDENGVTVFDGTVEEVSGSPTLKLDVASWGNRPSSEIEGELARQMGLYGDAAS